MKKWKIYTLYFISGVAVGLAIMMHLAQIASTTFAENLRLNFQSEQVKKAEAESSDGNWARAVYHYRNAIYSDSQLMFGPDKVQWNFLLPFASPVVENVRKNADKMGHGKRLQEGIFRAKLAISLEKNLQGVEAKEQFNVAMELIGSRDITYVRRLAEIPFHSGK